MQQEYPWGTQCKRKPWNAIEWRLFHEHKGTPANKSGQGSPGRTQSSQPTTLIELILLTLSGCHHHFQEFPEKFNWDYD